MMTWKTNRNEIFKTLLTNDVSSQDLARGAKIERHLRSLEDQKEPFHVLI